jgi:hypothetical protein
MLSHVALAGKEFLLSVYNSKWIKSLVPDAWKEATVIPGTDCPQATGCRPTSLSSCQCKDSGAHGEPSSRLDLGMPKPSLRGPVRVPGPPTCAWPLGELRITDTKFLSATPHLVADFFDLEKAYDTTWRYGIRRTLHRRNIRAVCRCSSHVPKARHFNFRLGNVLSARCPQENGMPQGSTLGVTLFAVSVNGPANAAGPSVGRSLYAIAVAVYYSSRSTTTNERRLQGAIKRLSRWTRENGFKFSPDTTKCLHFARLSSNPDPCLSPRHRVLPVVLTLEFLALILDSKLSWEPHMRQLLVKCERSQNISRVLSDDLGTDTGR